VFACKNGLIEQVEKRLLAILDCISISKSYLGQGDDLSTQSFHLAIYFDAKFFKRRQLLGIF
jgi:hypothetical protein